METIDDLILDTIYQLLPSVEEWIILAKISKSMCELSRPLLARVKRNLESVPTNEIVPSLIHRGDIGSLCYLYRLRRIQINDILIPAIRAENKKIVDFWLGMGPTNYDESLHGVLYLTESKEGLVIRDSVVSYFQWWLHLQCNLVVKSTYYGDIGVI